MGMHSSANHNDTETSGGVGDEWKDDRGMTLRPDGYAEQRGLIKSWCEIFDYIGGAHFRSFVVEENGEKAMFVFFEAEVNGSDLKPG